MKVSIIIPTYNVEPYIIECLQSVASQTYKGDMECIIVDDCGTDNSIAVAEEWIRCNGYRLKFKGYGLRFKGDEESENKNSPLTFIIVHREKNGGLSAARNSGFDVATGDYVYFLDSDDIITSTCIEEFVSLIKQYPEADFIQGGIATTKGDVVSDMENKCLPSFSKDRKWIKERYMLNCGFPVAAYSRIYKTTFLRNYHLRFHEGIIHEDVAYSFLIAQKCKAIAICKHNSYLYRTQREGSIINSAKKEYAFESRMKVLDDCINSFDNCKLKIQIRGVIYKILCYLVITDPKVFDKQIYAKVCMNFMNHIPFTYSIILRIFFFLPLVIQRNKISRNLLAFAYRIKL